MDTTTWHDQRPTHTTTEAQWLRSRAEHYEQLYCQTVEGDRELAEEYWQTAKTLQARAKVEEAWAYCNERQAWYTEHADNEPQAMRTFLL
jgi:hypothetical protein